jgi:hypothetical protein
MTAIMKRPMRCSSIETLEARIAPAALVVSVVGGTLKVVAGDGPGGVTGSILQVDADSFNVTDQGLAPVRYDFIKNISVVLSPLADQFTVGVFDPAFRGNVTVDGAGGADQITISGGVSGTLGDLKVSAAAGSGVILNTIKARGDVKIDAPGAAVGGGGGEAGSLTITGASVVSYLSGRVAGPVKITAAPDSPMTVTLGAEVFGNLSVIGSTVGETVNLFAPIHGKVRLALGNGGSSVLAEQAFRAFDTFTVVGGTGNDTVSITTSATQPFEAGISGAITLNLGDGVNSVTVNGNGRLAGLFRVGGGSGPDTVSLQGQWIGGLFQASLGEGDNSLVANNALLFSGARYTGGAGIDSLTFTNTISYGLVRGTLGAGNNSALFGGGTLEAGLVLSGGANNDIVDLFGVTVRSAVRLVLGDGNNDVELQSANIRGGLTYQGGAGTDLFQAGFNNTLAGVLNIKAGNGFNGVSLISTTLLRDFVYTGGIDTDVVVVGDGTTATSAGFVRAKIKLGDGNDELQVRDSVFRSFVADGGAGSDLFRRVATVLTAGLLATNFETSQDLT